MGLPAVPPPHFAEFSGAVETQMPQITRNIMLVERIETIANVISFCSNRVGVGVTTQSADG